VAQVNCVGDVSATLWGLEDFQKKSSGGKVRFGRKSSPPSLSNHFQASEDRTLGKLSRLQSIHVLEQLSFILLLVHEFKMSIDRRKAALFGAAAAVRLLLFTSFPGLPDLLTARVEISTPVTSFKRCKKAHII
jgi:hypothetical protein